MAEHVEIWEQGVSRVIDLDDERISLGRAEGNRIVLASDDAVSRLHAAFERFDSGWIVRDLGSSNGTFVNGSRISGQQPLHSGDEVRVGGTRIVFRGGRMSGEATTSLHVAPVPHLTRRELEVLVALCRPILKGGGLFSEPATVRQMAEEFFVSEAAIKQHIGNLYDKFGLVTATDRRRVQLANEAIARGAVSVADLRAES